MAKPRKIKLNSREALVAHAVKGQGVREGWKAGFLAGIAFGFGCSLLLVIGFVTWIVTDEAQTDREAINLQASSLKTQG